MCVLSLIYNCSCPGDSLGRFVIGVGTPIAGVREVGRAESALEGVVANIGSRQSQINSRIISHTSIVALPMLRHTGSGFDKADLTRFIRSPACSCKRLDQ